MSYSYDAHHNFRSEFRDPYFPSKEPACLDLLDPIPGIIIYSWTAQKFLPPTIGQFNKIYCSIIFHGWIYGITGLGHFHVDLSEYSSFSIIKLKSALSNKLLLLVSNVKSYWWSILSLTKFKLSFQNEKNQLKKVYSGRSRISHRGGQPERAVPTNYLAKIYRVLLCRSATGI